MMIEHKLLGAIKRLSTTRGDCECRIEGVGFVHLTYSDACLIYEARGDRHATLIDRFTNEVVRRTWDRYGSMCA